MAAIFRRLCSSSSGHGFRASSLLPIPAMGLGARMNLTNVTDTKGNGGPIKKIYSRVDASFKVENGSSSGSFAALFSYKNKHNEDFNDLEVYLTIMGKVKPAEAHPIYCETEAVKQALERAIKEGFDELRIYTDCSFVKSLLTCDEKLDDKKAWPEKIAHIREKLVEKKVNLATLIGKIEEIKAIKEKCGEGKIIKFGHERRKRLKLADKACAYAQEKGIEYEEYCNYPFPKKSATTLESCTGSTE